MNCRTKLTGLRGMFDFRADRRVLVEFLLAENAPDIQRHVRRDRDRLNFRLLNFSIHGQLIVQHLGGEIESGRLEGRRLRRPQFARLQIEPRSQLRKRAAGLEFQTNES